MATRRALTADLTDCLADIKSKTSRLKNWRNKWGSHWDLDVVLGHAPQPATSLAEIAQVLAGLQDFLNTQLKVASKTYEL